MRERDGIESASQRHRDEERTFVRRKILALKILLRRLLIAELLEKTFNPFPSCFLGIGTSYLHAIVELGVDKHRTSEVSIDFANNWSRRGVRPRKEKAQP